MIETELSRNQYDGNGVTVAFPFDFPMLDADELQVILTSASGVDTTLTRDTHYSVTLATDDGTVTMFTAPASGETLTILRDMDYVQPTDLVSQNGFSAEVVEAALDRLCMQILQLREQLGRAATVPASSSLTDFELPSVANGFFLGWSGGVLANLAGATITPTVSAFIETLLDDANAAAARATLGENASGSFFTRKHNFTAVAAPTTGDDTGDGYAIGSWWFDTVGDNAYVCTDATLGAAVWRTPTTDRGPQFKNRITNGDVRIDQRSGGSAVSVASTANVFGPDMWRANGEAADGVFSIVRSTSSPPAGFSHFLRATVTTADASIGAGQSYRVLTPIEGYNTVDLGFGAAGAKTVTLSFWARSSLTGAFSGSLRNAATNRSYPFSYTINAANTWELKSVTIAGDTSGTWPTDSSKWGEVVFDLGVGTSGRGAANTWAAAGYSGVTGAVSLISTLAATLDLTGVQLELGSAATDFERLPIGEAEYRCGRYHQRYVSGEAADRQLGPVATVYGYMSAGSSLQAFFTLPIPMRATPTYAAVGAPTLSNCSAFTISPNNRMMFIAQVTVTALGAAQAAYAAGNGYTLSAEL